MKSINYAGSEWSKWDLHIHTNASDGKGAPDEIISKALEEEIEAIAVTDHHTVKNIDEIRKRGEEEGITVISGIEFRTEYGAKSVHMIGLFPEKIDGIELGQAALEQLILHPLNLSEVVIRAKGKEKTPDATDDQAFKIGMFEVQVDFKEAADLIHKYGGLVSVHAGNKASSIEEMKHNGKSDKNVKDVVDSLGTVKDELMQKYIDICELGGRGDKNASFYLNTYNKPSIIASDAHELNEVGRLFTWIKADRTFEGLRQIIYEPEARVKIQENIPEPKSAYQIIESLEINHSDFGNQVIPFNANMTAIIGGRSSGKSILLGSIAKLANYVGDIKTNKDSYNQYIDDVVQGMKLKWKDRSEEANRKVEYFPQSYINNLASNSEETIQLIEGILKGDDVKRASFDHYNKETSENSVGISDEINKYFKLSYKVKEVQSEIENIGDVNGVDKEITKLTDELNEIKKKSLIQLSQQDEEKYLDLKSEKEKLELEEKDLNLAGEQLKALESIQLSKNIESDIIGLPEELKIDLLSQYSILAQKLKEQWLNIIIDKRTELEKQVTTSQKRCDQIIEDNDYCQGEEYYKKNAVYTELNKRIDIEKGKLAKINKLQKEIRELDNELKKAKNKIVERQRRYFFLGQKICEDVVMEKEDVKILPRIRFEKERFKTVIESNLNRRGAAVNELMAYEFESAASFGEIVASILDGLLIGKFTLKGGKELNQVVLEIMANNYCGIWYDVEYQGDTLSSMSEGKKAFIVLRMLLDFSENMCPILIDQPEDDLDNRAIYTDLVSYIRNKKRERQIIIVTHNPNIVVGADAEEIIVANQHGIQNENQDNIKFEYSAGALENSKKIDKDETILIGQGIREHVCDLLEGGDIAFKKRECKYGFSGK